MLLKSSTAETGLASSPQPLTTSCSTPELVLTNRRWSVARSESARCPRPWPGCSPPSLSDVYHFETSTSPARKTRVPLAGMSTTSKTRTGTSSRNLRTWSLSSPLRRHSRPSPPMLSNWKPIPSSCSPTFNPRFSPRNSGMLHSVLLWVSLADGTTLGPIALNTTSTTGLTTNSPASTPRKMSHFPVTCTTTLVVSRSATTTRN